MLGSSQDQALNLVIKSTVVALVLLLPLMLQYGNLHRSFASFPSIESKSKGNPEASLLM
jgi:hypothetical protein